jgi:hypothetical protein
MLAGITYVARTRSGRFLGSLVTVVSLAVLLLYGVMTCTHGIPQNATERMYWVLVIALPVVGLALGGWMLRGYASGSSGRDDAAGWR